MALDPQAKSLLDQLAAANAPPLNSLSPADARQLAVAMGPMGGPPEAIAAVEDRRIPGPAGEIPVRIYTPAGQPPFPALVFFHGGGWVIGTLDMYDTVCRALANAAGCVVVSVDYRLAPEQKFPAAAEDTYAATQWVARNTALIHVDPKRIAIGGDSAGGNLTAVTALMARDRGGPPLVFQLLVYPVTDASFETRSYRENADGYFLTKEMMQWFWGHYLKTDVDAANPYASPLRAQSVANLPPALVITAEYDPLRDEGEAYAERLRAAGVAVKLSRYDGMIHGFFNMGAFLERAGVSVREAAEALRAAFQPRR